jgi:uncharacterized protein (TIGR03084 family)
VDGVVAALAAQHDELSGILAGLGEGDWRRPTRCEGWDICDVVLHLAQTDELAIASATGTFSTALSRLSDSARPAASVDDAVAAMVERERETPPLSVGKRWSEAAHELVARLDAGDLSERVQWVAGELSLRTLATTRLAETWIHCGDVAGALGITLPATDRLQPIARLAWRTLPYAFSSAGRDLSGPVAFRLSSPGGQPWEFLPDERAVTTITGPAAELCAVAARRVDPSATSLGGEGPDADAVLALVRTYA